MSGNQSDAYHTQTHVVEGVYHFPVELGSAAGDRQTQIQKLVADLGGTITLATLRAEAEAGLDRNYARVTDFYDFFQGKNGLNTNRAGLLFGALVHHYEAKRRGLRVIRQIFQVALTCCGRQKNTKVSRVRR